jgi:hypothetical protein
MTRKSKRNYDIQMATPNEHKEKTREMGERDKGRGVEKKSTYKGYYVPRVVEALCKTWQC